MKRYISALRRYHVKNNNMQNQRLIIYCTFKLLENNQLLKPITGTLKVSLP